MGKILVIAEKPSVGRDIGNVLGCKTKGDGYIASEKYIVSWAIGHLITLLNPEDYDESLKKWRYQTLPIIPEQIKLKPNKQTKKQLDILKKLMNDKEIEEIICATDSGREGELIFRYIYLYLKCKKPFKRLWISSMTDKAIQDGFAQLKDGSEYDHLFLSAKCRSEADWLVGINASRAYTIQYDALLSIGRVQTPTLSIVVERQREINAFVPKDYYEVKAVFETVVDNANGEMYQAVWFQPKDNESKIDELEKAEAIVAKIVQQKANVKSVDQEEKKLPPPLLYDLTELQRDCNQKFGFSAQKTLSLAQDLYEKRKLITYPRTDSRYLSDDMIPKLKPTLERLNIELYAKYLESVLSLEKLPITKRIIDNTKITDHHAIIPTDAKINIHNLSADEMQVFDLIARRFIAVFYPHYMYSITKITTTVLDEHFMTKGTTIIQAGWTALNVAKKKKKGSQEEMILPNVTVGQDVLTNDAIVEKKKTEPPKAYNEAMLLSAMENAGRFVEDENLKEQLKESGIGTPATRAAIIERLIEVGYIVRNKKILQATDKGMKLIEIVPNELKSAETTGKWEKGLSAIAKGTMDHERFMASIKRYVNFLVQDSATKNKEIVFETEKKKSYKIMGETYGSCPNCASGKILKNTKAFYCSEWRSGCKLTIWQNTIQGELTQEIIDSYRTKKDGGTNAH